METVSREELHGKIDRGESFTPVETLQPVAYQHEQLPGLLPDKGAKIVVYCSRPT